MRVLVVTPWFPAPSSPGAGVFNLRDVELLARDHDVTVLHLGGTGNVRSLQLDVRVIPTPYSFVNPASWLSARRAIRRSLQASDMLHTMAFPALLPFAVLAVRIPWVHTEHWSGLVKSISDPVARLGGRFLRRLLRRPDEVVAVGTALAISTAAAGARSVSVIPNFVMLSENQPRSLSPNSAIRVIGVGGLAEHKGPMLAVEAVDRLARADWDVYLTWAGDGPQREQLESRVAKLGLEDRVEFVGHTPPDKLTTLLLDHNLFVLPTTFETFGVAVAEALGHGLPVVVTGEGEHVSFLPDRGSRVVERTAAAIADGIVDLARDPGRMSSSDIGQYAVDRFSNEARRAAYAVVYRNAVLHRGTVG